MTQRKHSLQQIRKLLIPLIVLILTWGIQSGKAAEATPFLLGAWRQSLLQAEDPGTSDALGFSVDVDGDVAVVGAPNEDPSLGGGPITNAGAVYVFERQGFLWAQTAKLVANDPKANDLFGVSVAIDGNTIAIGAVGKDVEDEDNAGAVYVFRRAGTNWYQQSKLVAAEFFKEDSFGVAVDLDDGYLVIGADTHDNGSSTLADSGAAYIFVSTGSGWDQRTKITAPFPFPGDLFGSAVAIDGRRVVVGAIQNHSLPEIDNGTGVAYVFKRGGWNLEAVLDAADGRRGDSFGHAVGISGDTVIVGARFADPIVDSNRITNGGAAYIFIETDSGWEEDTKLTAPFPGAFDHFGYSVDISGNVVVVGASGRTRDAVLRAGEAFVFRRGSDWLLQTSVSSDFALEDDNFGRAVAISGNSMVVGADGRTVNSFINAGEAYAYQLQAVELPATGFAPHVVTELEAQPASKAYKDLGDLWLEIPSLGVEMAITSIPRSENGWDVRWLGERAGYMEGTAFPTWQGNTGIAGHVTLPNGQAGPFSALESLGWGDQVIVHAWGQSYLYEVRTTELTTPTDAKVLQHENYDWVTLITCQGYDEQADEYNSRVVVRAVLVAVK